MTSTAGDPFGEHIRASCRVRLNVLGGIFTVESTSPSLLELAVSAFGGLPRYRLARAAREFRVRLVPTDHRLTWSRGGEPPRPVQSSGCGLLCATIDAGNFAVVDAALARAMVCVSPGMLRFPYHARYELIEFAVLMLASRAQSLVPLHAACVGARGSGLLLMGPSGAGKSTLGLHALSSGMQLLSEDGAFVALDRLVVTGVPNYLHVRPGALEWVSDGSLVRQIRHSPIIRRRSGVQKYEVDLREIRARATTAPLRLAATVFLSPKAAGRSPALRTLDSQKMLARLRREQPYAAGLSNWKNFERRIVGIPAYELRRTEHPDIAVRQLQTLLAASRIRPA